MDRKYTVYLRAFEPEDYQLINKWRNDYDIQNLTCGHFRYVSSQMEKSWVEEQMMNNRQNIYLAIILNDGSDRMIGYTSINNINYLDRNAKGGGIVIGDKESRNIDILVDANILLGRHIFCDLNLHRISGACLEEHTESRMMMELFGMRLEGIEYDSIYKNGRFHNKCLYSLLSTDYFSDVDSEVDEYKIFLKRFRESKKRLKESKSKNK